MELNVSIASLILNEYITIAELLGLWVLLGSNVHLKRQTIKVTRIVIVLIFLEAVLSVIVQWTAGLDHLTYARIILTPTVYLLHPIVMLGIMEMAEYVGKRRLLFYLPILIIDSADQPMEDKSFEEIYPSLVEEAKEIGIQTIFISKSKPGTVEDKDLVDITEGLNPFHQRSDS